VETNSDLKRADFSDFVKINLGENCLILDGEIVVEGLVKLGGGQTFEIPQTGENQIEKLLDKIIHPKTTESDFES